MESHCIGELGGWVDTNNMWLCTQVTSGMYNFDQKIQILSWQGQKDSKRIFFFLQCQITNACRYIASFTKCCSIPWTKIFRIESSLDIIGKAHTANRRCAGIDEALYARPGLIIAVRDWIVLLMNCCSCQQSLFSRFMSVTICLCRSNLYSFLYSLSVLSFSL